MSINLISDVSWHCKAFHALKKAVIKRTPDLKRCSSASEPNKHILISFKTGYEIFVKERT